jgi:hypothetical protein
MTRCWHADAKLRPPIGECVHVLNAIRDADVDNDANDVARAIDS